MRRAFLELKRRRVFSVAATYLVVAWVLLQVSDLLVPVLSLPDWTTRFVLLLLVIGFVPTVIMAWAYELTPDGIKGHKAAVVEPARKTGKNLQIQSIGVGVLAIALAGIAIVWLFGRHERWARDIALPAIESYIDAGDWEKAYAMANEVERVQPDHAELEELWDSFTYPVSISTEPAGSSVYRRQYSNVSADWQYLGTTPLYDIRIPRDLSLIRLELDDRPTLVRALQGGRFEYTFDTFESLPEGMVSVPGRTWRIGETDVRMNDFYIGQYEVTNEEFKAFMDAGGYRRRDLWEHEIVVDHEPVDWSEAIALFIDSTGRPGPSTWVGGTYPDGQGKHPVGGVSWYEAAAYARFAGRELPTIHHWRRAFRGGTHASWAIPLSNLEANGSRPVGESQGVAWTGALDMAGNVREWCYNAFGHQRVMVGAGWNDAPYEVIESVTNPGRLEPIDRSATNGFRLVSTRDELEDRRQLSAPTSDETETLTGSPVSDEVFAAIKTQFDYVRGPLDANVFARTEGRHWIREEISILAGADAERLTMYLYLPESTAAMHQVVLYWPAHATLILDSVDSINDPLDFVLANGRAVAFPILEGMFDQERTIPDWSSIAGRDLVVRHVRELRRSIDYLESRADIDSDAIGYYGFSWGGRLGGIVLATEPRIKAGILDQAGLQHLTFPETNVVNFLPRVNVPVLQLNGRYDTDFVYEVSAKPFFDLIGTADDLKKHVVEPTGHFVPRSIVIGETLDWLDKQLGPVDPQTH